MTAVAHGHVYNFALTIDVTVACLSAVYMVFVVV